MNHYSDAYIIGHSTETALLQVKNVLLCQFIQVNQYYRYLFFWACLLYLMQLTIMHFSLGLSCKVLEWVRSNLEPRSQRVSVRGILSEVQFLLFGVPQGSVLSPLVFKMYTRPLGIIAHRYGVKYPLYPDNKLNFSSSFKNLENCIVDMDDSNSSKTKW